MLAGQVATNKVYIAGSEAVRHWQLSHIADTFLEACNPAQGTAWTLLKTKSPISKTLTGTIRMHLVYGRVLTSMLVLYRALLADGSRTYERVL